MKIEFSQDEFKDVVFNDVLKQLEAGYSVELDPDEADLLGFVEEPALTEEDIEEDKLAVARGEISIEGVVQ